MSPSKLQNISLSICAVLTVVVCSVSFYRNENYRRHEDQKEDVSKIFQVTMKRNAMRRTHFDCLVHRFVQTRTFASVLYEAFNFVFSARVPRSSSACSFVYERNKVRRKPGE